MALSVWLAMPNFVFKNYRTDDVTLSKTSFFLAADMEFFLLGRVPLRVTSGHPLFSKRSTNSWELALRAYDMQVRPSWSTLLTSAFDWKKSFLKSESKKRAHVQKLAISKKSTFFVQSSWNLVKIITSCGNHFHQFSWG